MQFFRPFGFLLTLGLVLAPVALGQVTAQTQPTTSPTVSPTVSPYTVVVQPAQQQPVQQTTAQTPLQQQQPIRMQPLQTPPKSITHNGVTVFQQAQLQQAPLQQAQHQQQPNQPVSPATATDRTMPPGYGSPFPTGTQPVRVASTETGPNRQNNSIFNLPPQPYAPPAQPAAPQAAVAAQSPPMYAPPVLTASAPGPVTGAAPVPQQQPPQRHHIGRAEPDMRLPPFILSPQEQQELDAFLARWEKYSDDIKQYNADFELWKYDPTVPGFGDGSKPLKRPFGSFKFVAPDRFVYHIEGEWIGGARAYRNEEQNQNVIEEKIIIDSKAVYFFDYNAKKVRQSNIPPEMIRKGIADSPLPLIFGAKAADLKKRFSMKLVTGEAYKATQVWLQARPLTPEDQMEFRHIEIRLDQKTLRALALKKEDINGKAFDTYMFSNVKINLWGFGNALPPAIVKLFNPEIPRNFQLEVTEMPRNLEVQMRPNPPGPAPAQPQPGVANPVRQEIQLYSP